MKSSTNETSMMGITQQKNAEDGPTATSGQNAVGDFTRSHKQSSTSLNGKNLSKVQNLSMLNVFLHETDGPFSGPQTLGKPGNSENQTQK